ncbi:hypothetical protein U1Q18_046055 [Sarracenia purpurea var. burkii]
MCRNPKNRPHQNAIRERRRSRCRYNELELNTIGRGGGTLSQYTKNSVAIPPAERIGIVNTSRAIETPEKREWFNNDTGVGKFSQVMPFQSSL